MTNLAPLDHLFLIGLPSLRTQPYRHITGSFGVASRVNGELTREELIRRADMALYASKERGRDRVSLFQDSHDVAAQLRLRTW